MTARSRIVGAMISIGALAACVGGPPKELTTAEKAYRELVQSPAPQYAPGEVRETKEALQRAKAAHQHGDSTSHIQDLSYVAFRKAQLAEARARSEAVRREHARAAAELRDVERERRASLEAQLRADREQLELRMQTDRAEQDRLRQLTEAQRQAQQVQQPNPAAAETAQLQARIEANEQELARVQQQLQAQEAELERERQARAQAEQLAQQTAAKLADVAEIREEPRGMVISLSGSVLFPSGQSVLLASAISRLDQVAQALKDNPEQQLIVEGHSDAQGPADYNEELSYLRALAVRDHLVGRGIDPSKVEVRGFGESRPVASNSSAEGRANNRRVEIVLSRG